MSKLALRLRKLAYVAVVSSTMGLLSACVTTPDSPRQVVEQDLPPPMPAKTNVYPMPAAGEDLVGAVFKIPMGREDTLSGIAAAHDLSSREIYAANRGLDVHRIVLGTKITIPKQYVLPPKRMRNGIVINIPELRVYYFDNANNRVMTFPVALGRTGWGTPLLSTTVIRKQPNPTWYAPASIREYLKEKHNRTVPAVIKPGPDNPLGKFALYLGAQGYLIHGTNEPASIGHLVSSGCVRMQNENVEKLFRNVPIGTPVYIIHMPYKVGIKGNDIYLEAHRPIKHKSGLYRVATVSVEQAVRDAVGEGKNIDWEKVSEIVRDRTGIPTIIGQVHPVETAAVAPEQTTTHAVEVVDAVQ